MIIDLPQNTRSQLQETSRPNYKKGCYRHPISRQSIIIQTISDQAVKENTQARNTNKTQDQINMQFNKV